MGVGSAAEGAKGLAELTRVVGNHVVMVNLLDLGREGLTQDKGNMDSTKQT